MTDLKVGVKRPVSPSFSSSAVTERKMLKEAEAEFLYAVFESNERGGENGYFVYKRDHSSAAAAVGDASLPDLGQPIWSSLEPSNSGVRLVSDMMVFSWRSSIYFVGGRSMSTGDYQRDAFRLDLHKLNSSSGIRIDPVQIAPMNSIKRSPLTFGPIEERFYIFNEWNDRSFESFDLNTEKWDYLPLPESNPDIKEYLYTRVDGQDLSYHIRAATDCDSNIYLTPGKRGPLFVFCTKSRTWCLISYLTRDALIIPFHGKAVPLTVGNENLSISMPYTNMACSVYKCRRYFPLHDKVNKVGKKPFGVDFGVEGEVRGLEEQLRKLGCLERDEVAEMLFWSFANKAARICIVPCRGRPRKMRRSLIHICDLTLVEGEQFKVAVTSIVTYKHRANRLMMPRHFLFT